MWVSVICRRPRLESKPPGSDRRPRALPAVACDAIVRAARIKVWHGRDPRDKAADLAARRARRHRRLRQPLLPAEGRQAAAARRRTLQPRAALGHLQWRARGLEGAAGMACLAAPYGQRGPAAAAALSLGEAAPAEHDRDALGLSSAGFGLAGRTSQPCDRRLRTLGSGIDRDLTDKLDGSAA